MKTITYVATILVAIFAVSGVHGANLECPSICPVIFKPTCGTNGKEFLRFDNPCKLKVFNCNHQRLALSTYKETHIDWCTTTNLDEMELDVVPELDTSNQSCNKLCPMVYQPVCGSNGTYRKTFANECVMGSFGCLFKNQKSNSWRVLQRAKCSQLPQAK